MYCTKQLLFSIIIMRETNGDAGQKGLNVNMRATLTTVSIDFLIRYFYAEKKFYNFTQKFSQRSCLSWCCVNWNITPTNWVYRFLLQHPNKPRIQKWFLIWDDSTSKPPHVEFFVKSFFVCQNEPNFWRGFFWSKTFGSISIDKLFR